MFKQVVSSMVTRCSRHLRSAFWGAMACLAVSHAGAATQFSFTLDDEYITSAAVYDGTGKMVRTLTRGERLDAGTHTVTWDNVDDWHTDLSGCTKLDGSGNTVPCRYQLKLLKHKINYVWEGVIGNTSAEFSGAEVFRSFTPPQSLVIAGDHMVFTSGYNEGGSGAHSFSLDEPQRHLFPLDWQGVAASPWNALTNLSAVATDGVRLYWINTGGGFGGERNNFVLTSVISNRSYGTFAAGSAVCLIYRAGYTAPVAGMNYWNWCYEGQYYPSVIDRNTDQALAPTGIAVQTNGAILAVAHGRQGQVKLFDKVTGAWLKTFAVPTIDLSGVASLNQLAMAPDGDLWVIEGTSLRRYSNLSGEPTAVATITGLSHPLAVAVQPGNSDVVLVADGGVSQQIKAFNRSGVPLWTYGVEGGYAVGPNVSVDKLGFKLTPLMSDFGPATLEQTSVAIQADGSFWIIDTSNSRMLHIGVDHSYREQVAYLPTSYAVTVDPNNPRRVFSTFLEFDVDTAAPLQPGDSSWRLVRNWHAGFPPIQPAGQWNATNIRFAGLNTVVTLKNGRTYALAYALENVDPSIRRSTAQMVELPASGPARDTGITMRSACPETGDRGQPCVLYENGDLGYVLRSELTYQANGELTVTNPNQRVYRKPLLGFTAVGNPQWGAPQLVATVPADPRRTDIRGTPYYHQYAWSGINGPRFPITDSNKVVFFDPNVWKGNDSDQSGLFRNDGFHLGAVGMGEAGWSWMASPTGRLDGKGSFQTQATEAPDSKIQYGGNMVWTRGNHVVYGFHGEFYKDLQTGLVGQANQVMHFNDDGLFIGQFGQALMVKSPPELNTVAEQAGNAFSNILLPASSDALYWYHNDESAHGGVHRWRIDNIKSAVVLSGTGAINSTIPLQLPVEARRQAIVSLQASAPSVTAGASVTLSAAVDGNSPTGTVQFFDGANALQAPVSLANGATQLVVNALAPGVHQITAAYSGDGYNSTATSSAVSITVSSAGAMGGSVSAAATAANLTSVGSADWVHWGDGVPGIVRKATGGSQISVYSMLNGGSPTAFSNSPRALSWSDGAPTTSHSGNTTGVYTSGGGFSVSVPAGTGMRTVTVYVGGWNSGATFSAHLSDSSAADYTEIVPLNTNVYVRTYTITYRAASANQTLTLSWVRSAGTGNVDLNAVALGSVSGSNLPPTLQAPGAQTSTQGQPVTLAINANDPNADALSYSATGLPPGLVINAGTGLISGTPSTTGSYTTSVTVNDGRGGVASVSFSWGVQAAGTGSLLTGSVSTASTAANLSAVGTIDWAHWGDGAPGLVRKTSGGSQISNYTVLLGSTPSSYNNDPRSLSWSGGSPTTSATTNTNGLYVSGQGNGFSLSVPASTTRASVTLYVGGWASSATLRAHLSDGSLCRALHSDPYAHASTMRR